MKQLLTLILFTLFSLTVSAETLKSGLMKGEAFDKKNKLVYVETHTFKMRPGGEVTEIQTMYHNPEGRLIAELKSNFEKDPFIPETLFVDHRFNEKQELSYDKASKMVNIKYTLLKTGKTKTRSFKRTDDMVSAQGFHNFILGHYSNKKFNIKFIVLPRLDYYSFYFEKMPSVTAGQSRFVLRISSWVLRALVKEIAVEYNDNAHALLSFEGTTNIESDDRKPQSLKIKMSYP